MEGIVMDTGICMLIGPAIGVVVQLLKRIPLVKKYPKVTASAIALAISIIELTATTHHVPIAGVILCILNQLEGAISSYEVVLKPLTNKINQLLIDRE
jgi:hypothetical protein